MTNVDLVTRIAKQPHLITFVGMRRADGERVRAQFIKELKRLLMQRTPVESSNIKSIGYFEEVLEVEFISGGIYHYFNVPQEVFNEFLMSNSKGQFFHKRVKNEFLWMKVDQEEAA